MSGPIPDTMRDCRVAANGLACSPSVWSQPSLPHCCLSLCHRSADKKTFFNVALLAGSRPIQKRVKNPGLMTVVCDAHPFMQGFVMVFDHDLVATTDALGLFSITDVPPGKQEISIWHETLGALKKQMTVPPQGNLTVTFEYP